MNEINKLARALVESPEIKEKKKTSAYDTTARVLKVEGNTAWVAIPGGVERTPATMAVSAKAGDDVRVRITGNKAYVMGNPTCPPTDDTLAKAAQDQAIRAAMSADKAAQSAETAHRAADNAVKDAVIAKEAAGIAKESADHAVEDAARAHAAADQAQEDAAAARRAASTAQTSADTANKAANNALTQLSTVEDVVGVLNWISEHGTYKLSSDTSVVNGKFYFTRSGSGTDEDPYVYSIVVTPSGDPSSQGWYELDSIDEAVSSYVRSHLALTDAGLWVVKDNSGYKILLANDGMRVYDSHGGLVATFGQDISFSADRPQYIGNENIYIAFNPADGGSIVIGGGANVQIGTNKTLDQVLTDIDVSVTQTASGADITVNGDTVSLTNGTDGEDAVLLKVDSSNGFIFKNNTVNTILSVTIFKGSQVITDADTMHSVFGAGSYIQWTWKRLDDERYGVISADDSRIYDGGFKFRLSPEDVDTKVTFQCTLMI